MSVIRQQNWQGNQRVDAPHLRAVESGTCGDFDALAGKMISGGRPLVISGYTMATFTIGAAPETLVLVVAGSSSLHYGATASGTVFAVPPSRAPETLSPSNPRVEGSFSADSVNYVGLDIRRSPDGTTRDFVTFLDPDDRTEMQRQVPLAQILDYKIIITTLPFSELPLLLPIAIVTTNSSGLLSAVQDARPMLGRLATGSDLPDLKYAYTWPQGRKEVTGQPFVGGDKAIGSLKDSLDAIMTRVWEIGGGERWSSAVSDRNVKMVRSGNTFDNGEYFEWDGTNLHWRGLAFLLPNSTGTTNEIADQLVDSTGLTNLADGDCLYVDMDYSANHTGGSALVALKAPFQTLGAAIPDKSRTVFAWREGSSVFVRDAYYPVGSEPFPDLRDVMNSIPLYKRARLRCQSSPSVIVRELDAFQVKNGSGAWVTLRSTGDTTLNVQTLAGGDWAGSTRFYIYAYLNGASLGWQVSLTPPDTTRRWKSGTFTHAFIGTFSTNTGPAVIPFQANCGKYWYINNPYADTNLQISGTGTSTTQTNLAYSDIQVPAFAESDAVLQFVAQNASGSDTSIQWFTESGGFFAENSVYAGKYTIEQLSIPFGLTGNAGLGYKWASSPGFGSLSIFVLGFTI